MRFFRICAAAALFASLGLEGCTVNNYYNQGPASTSPGGQIVVGTYGDPNWYPTPPRYQPMVRHSYGPYYIRPDGTWGADHKISVW